MKRLSKIFALILTISMIFTAFPTAAFAADEKTYAAPKVTDHLPWYYYNDMTKAEQGYYLTIRQLIINRTTKAKINASQFSEDFLYNKAHYVLYYSDSLTFDYYGYTWESFGSEVNGVWKPEYYELTIDYADYKMSKANYNKAMSLVDQKADAIIDKLDEDMDIREKIVAIHDTLIKTVTKDESNKYANTSYGALVSKKAVSGGFAYAFQYICEELDIPCVIVRGEHKYSKKEHAWNKVKIGKNWYVVDVTLDNDDEDYPKFAPKGFTFLADSEYKMAAMYNTPELNVPKATDTKKSYYELAKASFTDYESALKYVMGRAKLNTFIAVEITDKNAFNTFVKNIGADIYASGVLGIKKGNSTKWYFEVSDTIIIKFHR